MASRGAVHSVEGARELRRSLRKAGDDLSDLKDAHRKAAEIAAEASASLAPARSGRLRGTIRAAGTKTAGIIRSGKKAVPYAGPIHWGWKKRNIKANPFMSTGAQNSQGQWLPIYENHVETIVNSIEGAPRP